MELEASDIEAAMDDSLTDIAARDAKSPTACSIENQTLESSDHRHLVQILLIALAQVNGSQFGIGERPVRAVEKLPGLVSALHRRIRPQTITARVVGRDIPARFAPPALRRHDAGSNTDRYRLAVRTPATSRHRCPGWEWIRRGRVPGGDVVALRFGTNLTMSTRSAMPRSDRSLPPNTLSEAETS